MKNSGPILPTKVEQAETGFIYLIQQKHFKVEIEDLKKPNG